ncbi:unnamed protein product [Caenorhabditis auriculariae]|uniref:Elongator complex protein 4 n=1 Tax=Caenorhabditis auriculariae TaxID=2777116 RepID=A0A8S1HEN2_9PELO|nr:unnamed protein product [Caenorhabditis auriculariae]
MNIGDVVQIAGCSTKRRLLETSSGSEAFDTLCGGALPNSGIVLLNEPRSRKFHTFLTRYFLAEGLHHKHACVIIGPDSDNNEVLRSGIPSRKEAEVRAEPRNQPAGDDALRIAWRYENARAEPANLSKKESYDFFAPIEDPQDVVVFSSCSYRDVYEFISNTINQDEKHTKTSGRGGPPKNFLRVVIQNIGSPLWTDSEDLPKFLILLRALMRTAYGIVYLSTNSLNLSEKLARQLEVVADIHVELVAFKDEEKQQMKHLGPANGYFRLVSLSRLATVGTHTPPILDLVFEASRKGFEIRVLHLPPAVNEPSPAKNACNVDF